MENIIATFSGKLNFGPGKDPNNDRILSDIDVDDYINEMGHPLTGILPCIDGQPEFAYTNWQKEAHFNYLDPNLQGPRLSEQQNDNKIFLGKEESLFRYLSRTISYSTKGNTENLGKRFVEPGVGRSFLVDLLSLQDQPDYQDFSATGIGLTPYCVNGFVPLGRNTDGKAALSKSIQRKNIAGKLNSIGCRASKVVGIIEIHEEKIQMLDGTFSARAILIRAFKNILRVKQIDPIAGFYHSLQHSAKISAMMIEDMAEFLGYDMTSVTYEKLYNLNRAAATFELFATAEDDFSKITSPLDPLLVFQPEETVKKYRQSLIKKYCANILNFARQRVANELKSELNNLEYLEWFSNNLGKQLAIMKKTGFLHDYHHPGISRFTNSWVYTLLENNVTLSAEFADLETSLFLDDSAEDIMFNLKITKEDVFILRKNFLTYHNKDFSMAKRIVQSVANAAFCAGLIGDKEVLNLIVLFNDSYKNHK